MFWTIIKSIKEGYKFLKKSKISSCSYHQKCGIWWNKITKPKKFWDLWCLFYFAMNVKYENVCNLHILFNKYFLQRITSNNMEQKRVGKGKIYFAKTVFVCPANDNKNSKEPYSSKCKNGVCWLATLKHFIFLL